MSIFNSTKIKQPSFRVKVFVWSHVLFVVLLTKSKNVCDLDLIHVCSFLDFT